MDSSQLKDKAHPPYQERRAYPSSSDGSQGGYGGGDGVPGLALRVQYWVGGASAGSHPS